ncbi:hypothetical protein LAZ67_12002131 [Cordylochernes scorpioides]|uniref:Reverse transcriptase RNase H-like domain-containing protein n=1 Tax=Cordylochernes scorpioides TaxID=51811 RepID=A0ABY6L2E0_9ARAC|nr:hypothetical protein LAZ67_12002131 [Cordylochernes scorpioides]
MAKAKKVKEEIENVNHLIMPNFVKYHPTLNIKTWLSNFVLKCDSYNLDAQWRILHTSDYLQDEALIYHCEILSNIGNWPEAKEKLINRFQKIELTPLVEAIKVYQGEQETISDYYHRKMKMINLVELPSKSIVELLNEGILKKYKPYLATIDTDRPLNWLTMATKIEKSLTGSGTQVEKGHLQTSNPALHPSPRPARYYGNSQVQRPPSPCRICERLGLALQRHYHSVCPYHNSTVSRSFPPATPRVHRPTASRSFPSATSHPYQAAASSTFPPPTPHDYQPTVASASSPDSPSESQKQKLIDVLGKYKNIFAQYDLDVGLINTIPITFRLTTDRPIVQKPYRTSYANNTEINRQIHELLKYNIIRPSCSAYASPILLVQKKSDITGRPTRLCIDFRKLNIIIKTENYPIPLIEEILDRLGNAKMFTSLDIHFTLHTDHMPLKWLKTFKNPSGRIFRWSLLLKQYDFDIQHIKGSQNCEADMLSRTPITHYFNLTDIKQYQQQEDFSHNRVQAVVVEAEWKVWECPHTKRRDTAEVGKFHEQIGVELSKMDQETWSLVVVLIKQKTLHVELLEACNFCLVTAACRLEDGCVHSKKWVAAFKLGRISTEDEHRPGKPIESVTQENIDKIHDLVMLDRRMTVRQIEETLGIPKTTVDRIMREHLGLRKLSARSVPKLLTPDQKAVWRKLSSDNLALFEANPEEFVNIFGTMDKTWALHFAPESKQQFMQWTHSDFLNKGQTITGNYYSNLVKQLREPIKEKRRGKLSRKIVYHQDNAPSHRSLQAMAAIYDSGFELLPHAPYSPDLALSDFHLFPHLKKTLSGIHFRSAEEVIDAVTSFFESLETSFFLEGIKALEHRWKKCIDLKGDYVEE